MNTHSSVHTNTHSLLLKTEQMLMCVSGGQALETPERRSETWIHTHLSTLTHTHCYWRLNRCWCVSVEDKRYTWETIKSDLPLNVLISRRRWEMIRNMNTHSSVHTNTHSLLLKTEQMLMCVSGGQALETPERRSETWIHTHLSTLTHTHCYWRLNRCWCVSVEDKRYTWETIKSDLPLNVLISRRRWETIRNMNTHSSVHTNTHSLLLKTEQMLMCVSGGQALHLRDDQIRSSSERIDQQETLRDNQKHEYTLICPH